MRDIHVFLNQVLAWAARHEDIAAVFLCGSFARGTARDDSDIDVCLLIDDPQPYLKDEQWIKNFGLVKDIQDENWGAVQSKRVFYTDVGEVEFGLSTPQWAATDPVDAGTRRVVTDGIQILSDPKGLMASLVRAVQGEIKHH